MPGRMGNRALCCPERGFDTGNYKPGHATAYAAIMMGAMREFGDVDCLCRENSL